MGVMRTIQAEIESRLYVDIATFNPYLIFFFENNILRLKNPQGNIFINNDDYNQYMRSPQYDTITM